MPGEEVSLDVTDGIATITLDRPDKKNALTPGIVDGVDAALADIAEREGARCVVVQGAGDAFCAGGDVSGMAEREELSGHERVADIVDQVERVAGGLSDCDLPTIARVDGYCFGAGMGVALACDVVLASEDATFSLAFRNVGLTLDYGTSVFVTQAVGPYKAKELALTGERLSGARADEMGLVNQAYPPEEFDAEADEFVETVASGPTVALSLSMQNIDRARDNGFDEMVRAEAEAQVFAAQTDDHSEGVAAFAEGREAEFEGR